MRGQILKVTYFLSLFIVSILIHIFAFNLISRFTTNQSNQSRDNSVIISRTVPEETRPRSKQSDSGKNNLAPLKQHEVEKKSNTADMVDRYDIGVLTAQKEDQDSSYLGLEQRTGFPDLSFDYGGRWLEITHGFFKELDIIFHPSRSSFCVIDWPDGQPRWKRVSGMSVPEYIMTFPGLFIDKVKDRKEEFEAFKPLQSIFEKLAYEIFGDLPKDEVLFIGVMPKDEMEMIIPEVSSLDTQGQSIHELKVLYRLKEGGLSIDLEPIE
jgi:hypothetical protein